LPETVTEVFGAVGVLEETPPVNDHEEKVYCGQPGALAGKDPASTTTALPLLCADPLKVTGPQVDGETNISTERRSAGNGRKLAERVPFSETVMEVDWELGEATLTPPVVVQPENECP
jgi:hypothetical protein